jgi:hypothetical protein
MHSVKKCAWGKRNTVRWVGSPLPAGAWEKRLFDSLLFLQAGNVPFVRVGSVICEFGESNFYPSGKVIANRLAIG